MKLVTKTYIEILYDEFNDLVREYTLYKEYDFLADMEVSDGDIIKFDTEAEPNSIYLGFDKPKIIKGERINYCAANLAQYLTDIGVLPVSQYEIEISY